MTINITFTAIILVYIAVVGVLGARAAKYLKERPTFHEYGAVSGGAGAILIGFSVFTSTTSASSFVGWPGNGYNIGLPFILGLMLPTVLAPYFIVGKRLRRVGSKHKITTIAEYVGERFDSKGLRAVYACLCFAFLIPYMAVQIQALGMAFEIFGGWSYNAACIVIALVVIGYCAAGGMRAAIWTDVIQGVLMLTVCIAFPIIILVNNGGLTGLLTTVQEVRPEGLFPPGSPAAWATVPTVLAFVFSASLCNSASPYGGQKYLLAKSDKAIYKGSLVSLGSGAALHTFFQFIMLLGVVALFPVLGDLRNDQLVYTAMQMYLPMAVSSILIAGIAAASMSSVDSMMVMSATAIMRDLVQKVFGSKIPEKKLVTNARLLAIVIGVIALIMALNPVDLMFTMIFFTMNIYAVSAIPMIAGLYWKRATKEAALISVIVGEITLITFSAYGPLAQMKGIVSSELTIAVIVTVVLMVGISLITPRSSDRILQDFFPPYKASGGEA